MSRTSALLWRVLLSLVALLTSIIIAQAFWGHGDFELVYISPPVVAIWFSDRTIVRRLIATLCGEVIVFIFQVCAFMIVWGLFIKSEPYAKAIGPLLVQVAAAWAGYWVTKELLRSNPTVEGDARKSGARPSL